MQEIILEVQTLNREVQAENARLLQMLQRLSLAVPPPPPAQDNSSPPPEEQDSAEEAVDKCVSEVSRVSSLTLRQKAGNRRCDSCDSIKQSRRSEKTLSRNKKKVGEIRHETNMARLVKITQKLGPRLSNQLLLKKKSRIFHYERPA